MKKGISIVTLVITIIIMIILAGVAIFNGSDIYYKASFSNFQTEITQVKILVRNYEIRKNNNLDFATMLFDISSLSNREKEQFSGENIVNNKVELYVINLNKIDASDTEYGNLSNGAKDRYLYSSVTKKVYYEKGFESNGEVHYTIQEES